MFNAIAIDLAKELPTRSEPINPGPCVNAIADSCSFNSAFTNAASITGTIFCWALDASSGTTPPYWCVLVDLQQHLTVLYRYVKRQQQCRHRNFRLQE
jgi:hypothetical protein